MMMRNRSIVALGLALALGLAACGGGSSKPGAGSTGTTGGKSGAVDPADCGLAAFANAKKPVEVKFWHEMSRANADWLVQTTNAFNKSQHDVHVTLVQFPAYQDLLTKYLAGLSTKDLPDLFQPEDTTVQRMIDSKSVVPVQACVDADHYPLSQLLPRATAYFSLHDVLYGMPWSLSNPVLWYNRTAFTKAGLDPNKPPQTLAQVKEYSQKIVSSGAAKHGIALRVEPYIFEFLNAKSGGTLVNNGNGRQARATAATIDTPLATQIWSWWNDMVHSGLALNTGGATGNIDHMLAVGNGNAAMTMEASGVLGTVKQVLEEGQYSTVRIGTAPLPTVNGGGGVPVGRRIALDREGGGAGEAGGRVAVHQVPRDARAAGVALGLRRLRPDPRRRDEGAVARPEVGGGADLPRELRPADDRGGERGDRRFVDRRLPGRARRDQGRDALDADERVGARRRAAEGTRRRRLRDHCIQRPHRRGLTSSAPERYCGNSASRIAAMVASISLIALHTRSSDASGRSCWSSTCRVSPTL